MFYIVKINQIICARKVVGTDDCIPLYWTNLVSKTEVTD